MDGKDGATKNKSDKENNPNINNLPPKNPNYGKTPQYITKYKKDAVLKQK